MSGALRIALRVPCARFDVELEWAPARTALGLFGPSGAGKTTVLEALAGLRRAARGRIEVGERTWLDSERGVCLPPEERGVGYVPQDTLLYPHLDVLGNLRIGERRARSSPRRLPPERVLAVLELGPLARRPATELSGGERQRVALGRALCSAPELLLLDEPLAGLDLALRRRILPYLLRVRDEFGIPTLHVAHDPSEVMLLCDEICVLEAGRVAACGPPEDIFGGAGPPSAAGEGTLNVLRGTVAAVADSLARLEIEPGLFVAVADEGSLSPGQRVAVELRASDVLLARGRPPGLSAQNVLAAEVRSVHLPPAGDPHAPALVTTSLGRAARPVAVLVSRPACRDLELGPGAPVYLVFKAQVCRVLAAY